MLSLLFSLGIAHAKCMPGSSSFSPEPGSQIADRAEIVWTATGSEREQLEASGDLALVSEGSRVPLRDVETLEGSFQMTQLVLAPTKPLSAGRWTLVRGEEPLQERSTGELRPVSFVVAEGAPVEAPIWRSSPQVARREREELGCGPAVEVAVEVKVANAQWIEATVREAELGSTGTIRLAIRDGQISIGHGMCSGAFELTHGEVYFADLIAVGPLGQRVPADDLPIRFTAP